MTLQGGYFKEAVFYDKIERMTLWGPRNLHSSKDYHNQKVSHFDQKNKSKVTKI